MFCTRKCKRLSVYTFGLSLIVIGSLLVAFWNVLYEKLLQNQLSLPNDGTRSYKMWVKTPIPLYMDFHFFNWTNADEVISSKWIKKPKLEERGPYVFEELHTRENVVFNDNNTISFQTKRVWHFKPELSNGSLSDEITTLNTIAATVAYIVRMKPNLIKRGVNFLLQEEKAEISVTHNISDFLFEGYQDNMLDLVRKLHVIGIDIPFKRFGWFAERNGSASYDGNFTMHNGVDDIRNLGILTSWNGNPSTNIFEGNCGMVNGTNGELWYPIREDQNVTLFAPDICSSITLDRGGTETIFGVEGRQFNLHHRSFDNGSVYPEMSCFYPGDSLPSGVRNISQCKFGAPAFVSEPHFLNADPSYNEAVEGLNPDPEKHKFFVSLETHTGIPLDVQGRLQINIHKVKIPEIDMFQGEEIMMPMIWFNQKAALSQDLATLVKLLLMLPAIGNYSGYGIIGLGALLLVIGAYMTYKDNAIGIDQEELIGKT